MHKHGFTLTEILTAIVIVTILVVMAVPLYEKTVERSRLAEARTLLSRLAEAKLYSMDRMGCETYSTTDTSCPKLKHLNIAFDSACTGSATTFCSDAFAYSLYPSDTYPNAVCAKRRGGDYAGTLFLYQPSTANTDAQFLCGGSACEQYGFDNDSFTCTGV